MPATAVAPPGIQRFLPADVVLVHGLEVRRAGPDFKRPGWAQPWERRRDPAPGESVVLGCAWELHDDPALPWQVYWKTGAVRQTLRVAAADVRLWSAPAPAPAPAADGDDWGSASFGMSTAAPAPAPEASEAAPAPAPPTVDDDDEAPPAKRARLDDLLGPPPADEAPAPAIPNDGSFLATMKQALAAAPAPAPPVLPVPAPSSPPPPPPAQPSSPASWPTLSDFDKSRVEALSHSCPAAAGRLAEALSRRAPVAPASPAPPIAQPAPPGTPDAAFQDAVAML